MSTPSSLVRLPARVIKTAVGSALYTLLAFLGAGRLDWPRGWIYVAVFVGLSAVGTAIVHGANPELLEARARGYRKEAKPFDKTFYKMFLPLVLITPALAGMDAVRFAWAPLPEWTVYLGVLLFLISSALTTWALVVNRHAEGTVRIQDDRAHTVITRGPYRVVRHPMYAGTVIGSPVAALILGSGWALVPTALMIALFVWCTSHEDRTLRQELTGYEDYTKTTRYRLVPGVW